mmetsp:Transcript_148574/g.211089  ORF Transcript_148574/g.211089 Transcript_148574/m.211089 type:complete len:186 (+) Transcript_148574:54-611(+)
MSDSEVAEGAVPEVVESPVEEENGYSGKRERRERRNDANGLPQTAQMQDLFDKLKLDDVDSLQKTLNSLGNARRRGGKKEEGEGKSNQNLNRAVQIGNTIAKRYKTMEKQVDALKKNEGVFQQLRSEYEEASTLSANLRSQLEAMVAELQKENATLKEFITSKGLKVPEAGSKGEKKSEAKKGGK